MQVTGVPENAFDLALEASLPIVLDGGLATELEARGHDIGTRLWSAALLRSNPSAIVDAHRAYLEAGASIIITASYQASIEGFATLGVPADEARRLVARSVDLACVARREFLDAHADIASTPLVAASIGPYGATLHDGSEYTGRYHIDAAALRRFHEPRLAILDGSDADLLACETIPNAAEARVLADLLSTCRLPAWMSFCCRDERHISDGTPLAEIAAPLREHPRVRALGVNCTAPQFVESLIGELRRAAPGKAIVVYPNSGEQYDAVTNTWSGDASAAAFADYARTWQEAGAIIIGGCCRIGPPQIAALKQSLTRN